MAACYEEMNRSIFGPVVFNSAAPDDGNMMILDQVLPDSMKTGSIVDYVVRELDWVKGQLV